MTNKTKIVCTLLFHLGANEINLEFLMKSILDRKAKRFGSQINVSFQRTAKSIDSKCSYCLEQREIVLVKSCYNFRFCMTGIMFTGTL